MTQTTNPNEAQERVDACRRALESTCRESGAYVTGDGRIGEEVAAQLLGFAAGTLANRRSEGTGPPSYKLGGGGHRVTYRLSDLAAWIEAMRCE